MAERFGKLFKERRPGGAEAPAWEEKQIFERARSLNRRFSMAVGYTLGALLALFIGAFTPAAQPGGFLGFLRPPAAIIAMVFGGIAIAAWIGWLAARMPGFGRRLPR